MKSVLADECQKTRRMGVLYAVRPHLNNERAHTT